jgi:hypothetical protein
MTRSFAGVYAYMSAPHRTILCAIVCSVACASPGPKGARTARPRAPSPPCVDPETDLRTRQDPAGSDQLERARLADINHDGVDERLLSYEGYCGSGGCEWHLYASEGACFRWVGSLSGRGVDALPGGGRWRELESSFFAGSCEAHFVRARMDGGVYRPFVERDCRCVPVEGSPKRGIATTLDPPRGCTPWRACRSAACDE